MTTARVRALPGPCVGSMQVLLEDLRPGHSRELVGRDDGSVALRTGAVFWQARHQGQQGELHE